LIDVIGNRTVSDFFFGIFLLDLAVSVKTLWYRKEKKNKKQCLYREEGLSGGRKHEDLFLKKTRLKLSKYPLETLIERKLQ
jgi:hypothetical protein